MKTSNVNFCTYIAYNSTDEAMQFLKQHGSRKPKDYDDIARCIQKVLDKEEEKALMQLAAIHPDRELIIASLQTKGNADGDNYGYSDDADTKKPKYTPEHVTNAIVIASMALIAVAVFVTVLKT